VREGQLLVFELAFFLLKDVSVSHKPYRTLRLISQGMGVYLSLKQLNDCDPMVISAAYSYRFSVGYNS
jgi:hypothetical protein